MGNHVAQLGEIALLLALVAATWAGASAAVGARSGSRKLVTSSLYGTYAAGALLTLASSLIFFAILANDYSIKYVQHNSNANMPWYYKLTSYWGGLDGSMMFWAWLLSLFAALAVWTNRERHRELLPWVVVTLMGTLDFFLVLLIFAKRPFDTFLMEAPQLGKGMSPLLQDPYMAIHPPSLYLGLVSAAVPFAFAMAALITGNLDDSWLRSVRRWVIVSWFFLSLGLTLGMLWAYHVLGWGGYWGWDPVENAGALAWFTELAFLHSIIVQERRGMLKIWNVFLVLASFLLTMVATFLTRSGIVQSVHAFGSDPVLKWSFLGFMGFAMVLSFGLLIFRVPLLRSRGELDSWVSREFAFLVNNWILLAAALFILVATLFPTISEAVTGQRVNLATPFYTRWMVPIGVALIFLTGVGPLIAWKRATTRNLVEQFTWPTVAALIVGVGLSLYPPARALSPVFSENVKLPVAIINFALCAFTFATIVQEFVRGARVRQTHTRLDFFTSLVGLVSRNNRRYGGYIVHVGMVLMFLGFGGDAYHQEREVTLEKGQQTVLGKYTVKFVDFRSSETVEKRIVESELAVFVEGKEIARAHPAKWYFANFEEEPVSHVHIKQGMAEDLYLVLNGYDPELGLINLKLVVNPLVNWIWLGFALLAFGTGIAYLPERAYRLAGTAARVADVVGRAAGASLWLLVGAGLLLGASGLAIAQGGGEANPMKHEEGSTVLEPPRSPAESELYKKIVCMCGSCGRQLLSECSCGFAAKMRAEGSRLLGEGKSVAEVVAHFVAKYPEESPLADTDSRLWLFPYVGMILGAGGLYAFARRSGRKAHGADAATTPAAAPAEAKDAEYQSRLDDELDDLDA